MAAYPPTRRARRRRSPGEGSVYPAPDGRWRGAVSWTESDGSRQRRVISARTPESARARLDDLRHELRIGALTAETSRQTVAQYLSSWLERDRARVRPSTHSSREMHVRVYLVPALGRLSLARLRSADVERALGAFMLAGRSVPVGTRPGRGRPVRPISPLTARHRNGHLGAILNGAPGPRYS